MSQEDIQSTKYRFSKKQIVWGLVAIFAVYGTMAYSVQTLTIARPKIAADLDGLSLYAWSVSIPSLIMALVTIIFGKFSDMYGRRIMLMISLIACFIETVLSALSPNFIFMIIARSSRFKWMYIAGYGILTLSMFGLILLDAHSQIIWSIAVALLAGLGYGVIPTINTVVVQNAVPKKLMGVAMGAVFSFS